MLVLSACRVVVQVPLHNCYSGIYFVTTIYLSTAILFQHGMALLMTLSNSFNFGIFWVCLDIYCMYTGNRIEDAQSMIMRPC